MSIEIREATGIEVLVKGTVVRLVDARTVEDAVCRVARDLYGDRAFAWRVSGQEDGDGEFICYRTLEEQGGVIERVGEVLHAEVG